MKKLLAIGMVLVMSVAMLTGCGDKGGDKKADAGVKGEVYDAGNVDVFVPEGWMAIPVSDIWAEEENAVDPDQIQVYKGAESEWDILTCPGVDVVYYDEKTDMMKPSSDWYDEAKDIEPITAGDKTWEGFTGTSFEAPLAILWTGEAGGDQFQVTVWLETDEATIALDDADFLAILEGVTASAN